MSKLKDVIENVLIENNYTRNADVMSCEQKEYCVSAEYVNCYGTLSRSPFVINHPKYGPTRIECRSQEQSGTTDQKFPYLLECAKGMPEQNVVFVLSGDGFKDEAISFLKRGASAISSKRVLVLSVTEFESWLKPVTRVVRKRAHMTAAWGRGKTIVGQSKNTATKHKQIIL
jgi:hypothetical protein